MSSVRQVTQYASNETYWNIYKTSELTFSQHSVVVPYCRKRFSDLRDALTEFHACVLKKHAEQGVASYRRKLMECLQTWRQGELLAMCGIASMGIACCSLPVPMCRMLLRTCTTGALPHLKRTDLHQYVAVLHNHRCKCISLLKNATEILLRHPAYTACKACNAEQLRSCLSGSGCFHHVSSNT